MKRPLGFVALLYGGGLLLGEWIRFPLPFLFAISLGLAAAAIASARARPFLIWPLILFTGWTNLSSQTAVVSPNDLRVVLTDSAEDVAVRGTLVQTPDQRIYVRNEKETYRTLAQLALTSIRRGTNWQPAFGTIAVSTPGILPQEFFGGQEVEVAGIIAPPEKPIAPGLFDYRTYLRRQEIYFVLNAPATSDWRQLSTANPRPLSDRFLSWAKAILSRGLVAEDRPLSLLRAMTLGSKDELTADAYDPFIQSGTMHVFAISGLHIALIAGILVSLLRVLQVSRFWCGIAVVPLIWFYTGATGWQPSAIRSSIMMSIIIAGWALRRPSDLLNSLAAAALIILLWKPQQLFQAGFQLSFFVVLSIALLLPPLEKLRDRILRTDPLLPAEVLPRWRRWLDAVLRLLTASLATSLAAWIGSWPLTAYYFHLFSPVTLLANLLIVPLSSAALACNLGSLICGNWFPWGTELFNHSGWFWMWLMMKISQATIQLPGAYFYVRAPTMADFVIYYGAVFALISGFTTLIRRRLLLSTAVLIIAGFYSWRWHQARQSIDLTVLPLNGGYAVYCDAPGSRDDLLIDCGNANAVAHITRPFLQSQGVNRLSCLALTHGDLRQNGGADELQQLVLIKQIVTSSARFRSPAYRRLIQNLERDSKRWRKVNAGDQLGCWTILNPASTNQFPSADDNALVLRANLNGVRLLLLSDLGRFGQNALLEQNPDLHADVVIAGLPDKGEPLCDALLEAISPRLIVVADSEFPAMKRASPALRERLERKGVPVLYTRTTGGLTIRLQENAWDLKNRDGN